MFNELEIMKTTLRYLLIAAMIVLAGAWSVANAAPQGIAKQPQIEMKSTSVLVGSGSHLPNAAETGAYTTNGEESGPPKGGPRKGWGSGEGGEPGSGGESGEPGDWDEPWADPIGDALLPLALLACAYLILRVMRKHSV